VYHFRGAKELIANLREYVPKLRQTLILPGCGHWIQQERPVEVNQALLDFLNGLSA
jgi:pimeloyl-ACP methyl ester carboxylesterase